MGKQSRIQFMLTRETREQSRNPSTMTGHVKTLVGRVGQTPRLDRQVEWYDRLEWQLYARKWFLPGIGRESPVSDGKCKKKKKTRDWISRWYLEFKLERHKKSSLFR